jgi:hypothetical protein
MDEASRLTARRNQVVPPPSYVPARPESQDPIRERVSLMMVKEQPSINVFSSERFLYAIEIHAIRE